MTLLQHALHLASLGFHVFPIVPGKKKPPVISDFPNRATTDPDQIRIWWQENPNYNIGISTTRYGTNESLLVVDVDNKGEKNGTQEILNLEIQGYEFPETYLQTTPTGGQHLVYRCSHPVKQGVNVLGAGLDLRSRGGYIVGAGSLVDGRTYSSNGKAVAEAPPWLLERTARTAEKETEVHAPAVQRDIPLERATERARYYLEHEAPIARQGDGGDHTTYTVACRVKDFGVPEIPCFELLAYHWNDRCEPPWSPDELATKVKNAYRYGTEPIGASAPEAQFSPVHKEPEKKDLHPFEVLNQEYAFVLAGGGHHILWETKGPKGEDRLEHLDLQAFHQKHASWMLSMGDGETKPVTALWMKHVSRRSYDGICFMPGKEAPPRFYNLWKGFAVEPLNLISTPRKPEWELALNQFLEHAEKNVCRGDQKLFRWLIGYFAHLVQRPWEKPLTAIVFRGGKGVGKNALIDRVGYLLGSHYMLTSNRRYLVGNFNGHLENLLLFALDEAFWSGDKQAEGTLKDLITGDHHVIEHKGRESYKVENCTRVCIVGNEEWLVPASHDERRFAVFDVGDGRKQDRAFFQSMREGMERGAYRLLLRYLLDFDLTGIDVNDAPRTLALLDQKIKSLDPFQRFWFECLLAGRILGTSFDGGWQLTIDKVDLREAFRRYCRDNQIRGRIDDERTIGKLFSACLPSLDSSQKRKDGERYVYVYRLPDLEQSRKEFCAFIGHSIQWE